jgi:hypothetical protein
LRGLNGRIKELRGQFEKRTREEYEELVVPEFGLAEVANDAFFALRDLHAALLAILSQVLDEI